MSVSPQPIDYEGFQLFMATYLENDIPEDLCQHLFTSFKSKTGGGCSPEAPRAGAGMLGKYPMLLLSLLLCLGCTFVEVAVLVLLIIIVIVVVVEAAAAVIVVIVLVAVVVLVLVLGWLLV